MCKICSEDWSKKLGNWKSEAVTTLKHYWVGSKLLWTDVRVSSRLLLKLVRGKSLTRRERQQLTRTADMFRLVPFAIFIVVPFMELLLPVFLKVFPKMLPSTFQDKAKEEVQITPGFPPMAVIFVMPLKRWPVFLV
ncbi:hypothetical protein L7F22_065527 [Adiantum nelumboides]|nr:hypothetical protein [Adiantum nelumboides]